EYARNPGGGRRIGRHPHRVIEIFSRVECSGKKVDDVGENKDASQRENIGDDRAHDTKAEADAESVETDNRCADKCAHRRNSSDNGDIVRKQIAGVAWLTLDRRPFRFWLKQDPLNSFHEIHDTPPLIRGSM